MLRLGPPAGGDLNGPLNDETNPIGPVRGDESERKRRAANRRDGEVPGEVLRSFAVAGTDVRECLCGAIEIPVRALETVRGQGGQIECGIGEADVIEVQEGDAVVRGQR